MANENIPLTHLLGGGGGAGWLSGQGKSWVSELSLVKIYNTVLEVTEIRFPVFYTSWIIILKLTNLNAFYHEQF